MSILKAAGNTSHGAAGRDPRCCCTAAWPCSQPFRPPRRMCPPAFPPNRGGFTWGGEGYDSARFVPVPAEGRGQQTAVTPHGKAAAPPQPALGDAPAMSSSAWGAPPYLGETTGWAAELEAPWGAGGPCWLPAQAAHPLAPEQPCSERIMSDRVIYGVQAPGPMVFRWWEEEAGGRRTPAPASATPHGEKGAALPPTPLHGPGGA